MMHAPRYAVYLAPSPYEQLWHFGSAVLGYDAATGEETQGFLFDGFGADEWRGLTEGARNYGFHGTLKAPFRLWPEASQQDLFFAVDEIARASTPFMLDPLRLEVLGVNGGSGFLALVPDQPANDLAALERLVVTGLDSLRAPLTAEEIARRRPEQLSERQRDQLARFGYPFIFEDFQLHFTLSDRIPQAERAAASLKRSMLGQIGTPRLMVDALVLFEQRQPGARFRIMRRFPFGDRL
jgi:2'-5' RNA ligase